MINPHWRLVWCLNPDPGPGSVPDLNFDPDPNPDPGSRFDPNLEPDLEPGLNPDSESRFDPESEPDPNRFFSFTIIKSHTFIAARKLSRLYSSS